MRLFTLLFLLVSFAARAETPIQESAAAPAAVAPAAVTSDKSATSNEDEFLPPDQAFVVTLRSAEGKVAVDFAPAPGHYMYRERISFTVKSPAGASIVASHLPAGEIKDDPNFGRIEVYHHPFLATVEVARPAGSTAPVEIEANYQGCSEKGLCYPPMQKSASLDLGPGTGAVAAAPSSGSVAKVAADVSSAGAATKLATVEAPASDTDRVARIFAGGNFWVVIASFFGFGLLLSFTPCVFPMIPILSGIIVGQGESLTKSRATAMSASYVMGMAITYSAAGVAAGLSGSMLSAALQNPYVLGGFALTFVLLSLSMFGFYQLQLPSFLQSRLSDKSNTMQGGTFAGTFIMGALSALIVGPCVAAPLAGALLYIGQSHNVVLGGSALFAMALGMGVPLMLVGTSAGALLPRAGTWMEAVKKFFGVLLLGVAIWLVTPVIPATAQMLLWAALLIGCAMFLRAIDPLPESAGGFPRMFKAVGVMSLLAGASLVLGALSGGNNVLQPLAGLRAAPGAGGTMVASDARSLKFERVASVADLENRVKAAGGKPVMLDFYADWCVSCKEMEHNTFSDAKVQARLKDAVLLQADVTANKDEHKELLKRFGLFGPPGIIFFDAQGNPVKHAQVVGYQPPEKFLASLQNAM